MHDGKLGTEELKNNLHSCKNSSFTSLQLEEKMKRDMKDDDSNTSSS